MNDEIVSFGLQVNCASPINLTPEKCPCTTIVSMFTGKDDELKWIFEVFGESRVIAVGDSGFTGIRSVIRAGAAAASDSLKN